MNSQILRKITEKTASAEEFIEENHEALSSSRSIVKDHLKKAILSLSLRKQRYPDFLQLKKRTFSKRAYPLKHKALKRRQSKFHQ